MSTIKINWGARVALLYIGFVALIITLVYRSMNEDFDLVTKDYYGEEIRYQEVIDAGKNQAALSAPVGFSQAGDEVEVHFPQEFIGKEMKGSVQFYAAVNAQWDKTFELHIQDARATVSVAGMQPATYTLKLKWEEGETPYYQETKFTIQP